MKKVEIFIRSIADICNNVGIYCVMFIYKENKKIIYNEIKCNKCIKRYISIRNRGILSAMCNALKLLKEPCKVVFHCEQNINEIMLYTDNIDLIKEFYKIVENNKHSIDAFNINQQNQDLLHEQIIMNSIPNIYNENSYEYNKTYIYYIYDCIYKKYYVGKSINVKNRWYEHKRFGDRGYENNTYYIAKNGLYVSMKMNGINNFIFRVLETCNDNNEATIREAFWIKKLKAVENGYNLLYSFNEIASRCSSIDNNQIICSDYENKIHPEIIDYHNKYIKPLNKNIRRTRRSLDLSRIKNIEWIVFKITSKITKQYYINCRNKVSIEDIQISMECKMKEQHVKEGTLAYFLQQHNSIDDLYIEVLEYINGDIHKFQVIYKWCEKYNPELIATNFLKEIYINKGNVLI